MMRLKANGTAQSFAAPASEMAMAASAGVPRRGVYFSGCIPAPLLAGPQALVQATS